MYFVEITISAVKKKKVYENIIRKKRDIIHTMFVLGMIILNCRGCLLMI